MNSLEYNNHNQERIFIYDVIRVIAILAVIMIHCGVNYIIISKPHSLYFTAGNFFNSISRFGVPIFVMLSGVFMLDENRKLPIEKLVYKIKHLFFILIIWSAFYALIFHFKQFFNFFFFGHYHLWYLFIIIGLYLITPILRLFVNIKNKSYIYYFLILAIIFSFTPPVVDLIFHHTNLVNRFVKLFQMHFVIGFVAYYLLGWLLNKDWASINKHKNIIYFLGFISIFGTFLGIELYTGHYSKTIDILYEYKNTTLPVFLYSLSIFVLIKNIATKYEQKISDNAKEIISKLAQLTLGAYLIHPLFIELTKRFFNHFSLFATAIDNINPFVYIILEFSITVYFSFLTVYLMSKIKYINKLIQMK